MREKFIYKGFTIEKCKWSNGYRVVYPSGKITFALDRFDATSEINRIIADLAWENRLLIVDALRNYGLKISDDPAKDGIAKDVDTLLNKLQEVMG